MPRRRYAPPSDIEPLFHFCRHCGGDYTPQEGGIEGVCPECAQRLYTRCDECGATIPAADARRPSSGRTLCRSCATRLCYTCCGCGELHERSSTDFLVDAYGQTVCSSCWDDWEECSECGEYFPADDLEEGEDADEMLCRRCAARRGGRLIHPYSYKPEPIFHRAEGEGAGALALGIELEMDGGSPERAARSILALAGSDYLYFKRDSSLEDGAELVTHPVSPTVLLSPEGKELWRSICRAAESAGMRSHDTRTCGLHVHVSRAYFGQSPTAQALAEYKMLALVDRLFEPLAIFSRRRREQLNRWARRPDAPVGNDGWIETARLVHRTARHDRYQAVNIQNEATIELRVFRGTLRPETLFATFALVAGMCAVVRELTPGQLDRLTWYALCDEILERCPDGAGELAAYLADRGLANAAPPSGTATAMGA